MEEISNQPKKQGSEVNIMALICYLGFLCLIPILNKEKDEFVRFHAKQGLVILIGELATWILFAAVPFLFFMIANLFWLFWTVLSIIGIVNVVNKQQKEIPLVGQFAAKIKL
jgi:uncharacterized membrane protein